MALSLDPFHAGAGALWLIGWRIVQAVGGSMLTANSAAILTDAFPREQRGMALGVNQIAALAGQFLGLVAGGLLAEIDWRAVFWVSVPFGLFGTVWSFRSLREVRAPRRARIDWGGNITFAVGHGARCSPRSPTASSRTAEHPPAGPTRSCSAASPRACSCSSRSASSRPAWPIRCSTCRCSASVPSARATWPRC